MRMRVQVEERQKKEELQSRYVSVINHDQNLIFGHHIITILSQQVMRMKNITNKLSELKKGKRKVK